MLVAGLFGIVTVGNGASLAATRLLYAMGRARMIAPAFTKLHPVLGSPVTAIGFVTLFGLAGDFLGRSGIAPIVNVGSAAACLAYLFTSLGVVQLRRTEPDRARPYRIPAGVVVPLLAAAGSVFLMVSSVRQQWLDAKGGLPIEWVVMVVWAAVGVGMYRAAAPARAGLSEEAQRRIVMGD